MKNTSYIQCYGVDNTPILIKTDTIVSIESVRKNDTEYIKLSLLNGNNFKIDRFIHSSTGTEYVLSNNYINFVNTLFSTMKN